MHYYYIDFYIKYCNLLSFKLSNWASQQLGVVPPDSCSGNSILLLKILKNLPCISSIRAHLHAVSHSSGTCSGWLKAIPQPSLGLALSSHYCSLSMDLFPLSTRVFTWPITYPMPCYILTIVVTLREQGIVWRNLSP